MKKSDSLREQEIPMVLGVVELNRITLTPQRFPIRPTPPEVVSMTNNPIEVINFPPDPAPHTGIYRDIIALSSGTMATLTGINSYCALEAIQANLAFYYLRNYKSTWASWMDVWDSFVVSTKN